MTQHDLVRVSVTDETMTELRAITDELQALRPSVAPLCARAYRAFDRLVAEVDGQNFPGTEIGVWDVLHHEPDILAFRSTVDDLARDFVTVAGGEPVGNPDWLPAADETDETGSAEEPS